MSFRPTQLLGAIAATLLVAIAAPVEAAPRTGDLVADTTNRARLRFHNGGPAFFGSVGEPEGFLYRGTLNANGTRNGDQIAILNEMKARGLNMLYVNGFIDSRFGGD